MDDRHYERIAIGLGELHKKMTNMQNRVLEEYHSSLMEYQILKLLKYSQNLNQNELAAALNVDKALVSRQIRSMEAKGLLVSEKDPDCRRQKTLKLSDSAVAMLPKLKQIHRQSMERLFSDFGEERLQTFEAVLEELAGKV